MISSRARVIPAAVVMLAALGLGGCATKGFVRDQVAIVNQRVDGLEARLNETDATAKAAQAEAQAASAQGQANTQRLDQLGARVDGVEQRMNQAAAKRPRN